MDLQGIQAGWEKKICWRSTRRAFGLRSASGDRPDYTASREIFAAVINRSLSSRELAANLRIQRIYLLFEGGRFNRDGYRRPIRTVNVIDRTEDADRSVVTYRAWKVICSCVIHRAIFCPRYVLILTRNDANPRRNRGRSREMEANIFSPRSVRCIPSYAVTFARARAFSFPPGFTLRRYAARYL